MSYYDVFVLSPNQQEQVVTGIRYNAVTNQRMYNIICATFESAETMQFTSSMLHRLESIFFPTPASRARAIEYSSENILVFRNLGTKFSSWFNHLEIADIYPSQQRSKMIRMLIVSQFAASRHDNNLVVKLDMDEIFLTRRDLPQIIRMERHPNNRVAAAIGEFTDFLETIHGSAEQHEDNRDNFRGLVQNLYAFVDIDDLYHVYYHPFLWTHDDTVMFLKTIGDHEYEDILEDTYEWQQHFRLNEGPYARMYKDKRFKWEKYPDTLWGFFAYMARLFNHIYDYTGRTDVITEVILADVRAFVPDVFLRAHEALIANGAHWKRDIFDEWL